VDDLLKILLGGLVGAVIGPILLEWYRGWRRERSWKRPRKALLHRLLNGRLTFRTLDTLARTIGTSKDDCRDLLIEMEARGGIMADGREAWALIARAPLREVSENEVVGDNIDDERVEEEE
jgi:hypothetical protein